MPETAATRNDAASEQVTKLRHRKEAAGKDMGATFRRLRHRGGRAGRWPIVSVNDNGPVGPTADTRPPCQLQQAFSTTVLGPGNWVRCATAGSSVPWLREISKAIARYPCSSTSCSSWV